MKHGKKYNDSSKLVDRTKLYDVEEAMDLCVKTATAKFDESVWTIDQMRKANRESIYCDGVENITDATLVYTDELVAKVKKSFNVDLPKSVKFVDIENVADLIINQIIKPQVLIFVQ